MTAHLNAKGIDTNTNNSQHQSISIDSVLQALQHWRDHQKKHRSDKIPDTIWQQIFQLTQQYPENSIRTLCSITKAQYDQNYQRLCAKDHDTNTEATGADNTTQPNQKNEGAPTHSSAIGSLGNMPFCEAQIMDPQQKQAVTPPNKNSTPVKKTTATQEKSAESVPPLNSPTNTLNPTIKTTPKIVQQLGSIQATNDFLDPTTIVVECQRLDGFKLTLHVTHRCIKEVLSAFYQVAQGIEEAQA